MQPQAPAITPFRGGKKIDEKPKVQPREVAEKAIKEIKGVPPKLYLYALGGAGILILAIGLIVTFYVHSQSEDDAGAPRPTAVSPTPAQPEPAQPPKNEAAPAPVQPVEIQEPDTPAEQPAAPSRSRSAKKRLPRPRRSLFPGSSPLNRPLRVLKSRLTELPIRLGLRLLL